MMSDRPDFPTMADVEVATIDQLARWYKFLPVGDTAEQKKIMDRVETRLKKLGGLNESGGLTAALSDKVGHGGV
jgi:hypothetical protein